MKQSILIVRAALLGLGTITWASSALAQESGERPLLAPENAFELQLSTGYAQGFGNALPNVHITDVAGAGVGFTGDLAYRASRFASIDFEGQYNQYAAENGSASNGFNANVAATVHALPESRGDPWLRIGSGWRWVWQHNTTGQLGLTTVDTTNEFHGWEVVTGRIGLDVRTSSGVAWAPFFGADLQSFSWINGLKLPSMQWGSFLYAGVQGRFDFGGTYPAATVARGLGEGAILADL